MTRSRSIALLVALVASLLVATVPPAAADHTPDPAAVTIAGSLQSELGCGGDWDPGCAVTGLGYDAGDQVWQGTFTVPAGSWEYKAALNGTWDENYGANAQPNGPNIPLNPAAPADVKFYYDHGTHWITDDHNSVIATVPGDFQDELGCPGDWQADCLRSWLQDPDGDGTYVFSTDSLPPGGYEAKVAIDEGWAENYGQGGVPGGANIPFTVGADGFASFSYDAVSHVLTITTTPPPGGGCASGAAQDGNVFWNELGHDSRDGLYRNPGGAVTTGTPVTVRLRAACDDLTGATVRVWNDRSNVQSLLPMTKVAANDSFEWWEATIPASALPTIYWYRFIATDGAATAYYEDDAARTGGWGQTFGASPDNSWQLTVYDPSFATPDWVKDAIVYQIFPDRFRDGDPGNDTPVGTFFYGAGEPDTIYRSNGTDWNEPICDPRNGAPGDCLDHYSQNFYGGDLQGIVDQLDYLQDLGVGAIYLNPIFESPSNHKYDTTDFSLIDDNFGDLALYQTLIAEAHARDIRVVLDGVFNHTSSDSIYFDRYGRYPAPDGACESTTSPYRDWYYFTPAVPPGSGPCAGDTEYEAWFGFDSLPKLDSANPEVRELIWDDPAAIARYWIGLGADGWRLDVAGDVDPGITNDPGNDYWEGFRQAVRAEDPDTWIVGEEWGVATAWTLGPEWDATMNYQLSSAMLGFFRDTALVDNDHNAGSSAGVIQPLDPSGFEERLRNLEERYPPEAFAALMNLLGSHDTNRPLFLLDHDAATGSDDTLLDDPGYDWSDAIARLRGVTVLQMTLPGAPTIYYGDEVGLVGPVTHDGSTWQDDPYNRIPFPWLDEAGTPFYTHLQTAAGQDALRDHYTALTTARNAHPALRTGSLDTLAVDDAAGVYAFGRKTPGNADVAVVVANRSPAAQDVTIDVGGYLPFGATLTDVLGGGPATVDGTGMLTVTGVPARGGAVLVGGPLPGPPAAVDDLAVAASSGVVDLSWSSAAGADVYDVYRSLLSGGGFELLASTGGTAYGDTAVVDGTRYHYVVVSRDAATGLVSGHSNEASAIPALAIGWANLQWPPSLNHTASVFDRTDPVYGQVWIDGVTADPGATPGLWAQVGLGIGTTPTDPSWRWSDMTFNVDAGNNDEFVGDLPRDVIGTFCYTTRYSTDGGASWFYAVNGPDEGNPTCPGPFGVLTVSAGGDTTAPAAPTDLTVTGFSPTHIGLAWDSHPDTDGDLAGFEVLRSPAGAGTFAVVATLFDPAATSYDDTSVVAGESYDYRLVAFDESTNRSAPSNTVSATAEARLVDVTFRVGVPSWTPGTVHVTGSIPELGPWNPGLHPMTEVAPDVWQRTFSIAEGTSFEWKYTRGDWERVEWWGSIVGLANRGPTTAVYGPGGTMLIDNTATDWGSGPDDEKGVRDWRDPIVVAIAPADGAADVPVGTDVVVTWSKDMAPGTGFTVTGPGGPVAGSFAYDPPTRAVTFTPAAPLDYGTTYDVAVSGETAADGGVQQVPAAASFTTESSVLSRLGEVLASLQGIGSDDEHLEKGIAALADALDPARWSDPNTPHPDAFEDLEKAVKELDKADGLSPADQTTVDAAIATIVAEARGLADACIAAALAAGGDPKEIEKARKELAKAEKELGKGKADKAVHHFGKVCEHALKAIAQA